MQSTRISLAIAIGAAVVAWALYTTLGGTFTLPWGKGGHPGNVRPVTAADHIFGNPAAPVKIVEYCDFTSDYCKGFNNTLHEIVAIVGAEGEVAWVYRHFPLKPDTGDAMALARAAECAAKAGGNKGFFDFANALYDGQPVATSQLGTIADQAAIPSKIFADCYAAGSEMDQRIIADRKNALAVGADGAPYSVLIVKGKAPVIIDGAYPYDQLRHIIEAAMPASAN